MTDTPTTTAVDPGPPAIEFQPDANGRLTLVDVVFQALGAASACWDNLEGAGVFESERAKAIGDELMAEISRQYADRPLLGLVTTGTLLDELVTRLEGAARPLARDLEDVRTALGQHYPTAAGYRPAEPPARRTSTSEAGR